MKNIKKIEDTKNAIKRETQTELVKLKGMEEKAKLLKEEIILYQPGSPVRKRKEKKYTELAFEMKYRKEKSSFFFSEKTKASIEAIYKEIAAEIEAYAKQHNFFMVLKVTDIDFSEATKSDTLNMQIHTRDIFYWNEKFDITDNILKVLNEKYKREQQ